MTETNVVEEAAREEVKSCTICFQERIGKGIQHLCTKANRKTNLAEIVKKEEASDQIVAEVLHDVVSKRGGDDNEGIQLKQVKGGNVLTVTVGKRKQEDKCEINAEVTAKLKKMLDLSKRDTIKMLNILSKK